MYILSGENGMILGLYASKADAMGRLKASIDIAQKQHGPLKVDQYDQHIGYCNVLCETVFILYKHKRLFRPGFERFYRLTQVTQ